MKPSIADLLDLIDSMAPFSLAEAWDNSGLQVGSRTWPGSKVLLALDVTPQVVAEAVSWGADLVLTHHPLVMGPISSIDFSSIQGSIIALCARHRISIVSAHTNLDKAHQGLNDYFARQIDVFPGSSVEPMIPETEDASIGTGRIYTLETRLTLNRLVEQIKSRLKISSVRYVGDRDLMVNTLALCTGSGGSLVGTFLKSGADVFITGDVKYHEARNVEQAGLGLIDVGHFASEHMVIALLAERLRAWAKTTGFEIKVKAFDGEKDPFITV
ncbi:conserved hypothetical protein [Desulforapulum autotrophicum HRM2]|uniref:GTP cyclohydrolase 1 type 2 homolog n=1 Tax=Desulforapulum autotrophicum (strain ATCC 43914 / DSM 3382 / VKM B-1955 / HRM2) TaxID=177437 RepID=C0QJZ8_DESAH|nr:Nif3-like dinuclear metal center hexameric protein [Desulforapulum autotrophicum]ACN16024.1 conserved hypothetical protein [Desulforapulum autotrophicum HRM2]